MKRYLLILLCNLFIANAFSHTEEGIGSIAGTITTYEGLPAASVTVLLKSSGRSSMTDEKGYFILRNIPEGNYELEVSLIGYNTVIQKVTVEEKKTASVSIQLSLSDQELKEVVVKAAKSNYNLRQPSSSLRIDAPLMEVPQNIQIVTSAALADQQVISMSDNLIRNVSGATRLEHWGDLYTNITMRGSQIQAFRNGFNVVSSFWGPLTEDMSFVDHIEFVKGPAGFMLANGDPSGLYNVVTKKPTGQTKGEATFTMGSFDLYRLALDLDGKLSKDGRLLYRLNLAGQNKGSHRAYEENNRYSFAPVVSYQLDDKTKLTAEYTLQHATMSNVGSYYAFSPDGYAKMPVDFTAMTAGLEPTNIDDHTFLLNLQHQFNQNWRFTAQATYMDYIQEGSSKWPTSIAANGDVIRNVSIWDARSKMTMAQSFVNGHFITGKVAHRVLAGVDLGNKDYMADWGQSHDLDTEDAPFNIYNPTYGIPANGFPSFDRETPLDVRSVMAGGTMDQRYTGFYLQDELGFFNNKLRLTLAGRYTYVSQSSWGGAPISAKRFTPRLGASYSIDRHTSVYGVYDQAFLPQSGTLYNGEDVKPITGSNRELGIKRDWANGKWNTTLSFYQITKRHELTSYVNPDDPNPNTGLSVEIGEKQAEGVEFDIRGNITPNLNIVANYAYTNSIVTKVNNYVDQISVGDVVPGFAKHTANSWLSYKVTDGALKGAGINAGFTWLIDRATDTWSKTLPGQEHLPDYLKLDGGIFYEKDKVRLNLNVFNVLDEYLYSGSYYEWLTAYYWQTEAPRNFRFSIAYRF